MNIVALIPARAGSKRIPGKNTKTLAGHPLIAYTIAAAKQSGVFSDVLVCTDSDELIVQAQNHYGCGVFQRNASHDNEPDIQWVSRVVYTIGASWDAFAILRPTSPFRSAETIQRAYRGFRTTQDCEGPVDSLRAIEVVAQHPGKMWRRLDDGYLTPLLLQPSGTPWHSSPTQTLPKVYIQNASLEIAWTDTVKRTGTIAGDRILAFETQGWEGFDINRIEDWWVAERAIAEGVAVLPVVT